MSYIFDKIKELEINCPACEDFYDDDQYTCDTCWCEGGQGKINAYDWLKENGHIVKPYCEGVIHHSCEYFDQITACKNCQVKEFKYRTNKLK